MASNRGTSVHNSYLLVWAETGLLGLITFLLVLITPIVGAFRTAFRFRKEIESELLLGFSVAMTIIALHLLYEWLWIMFVFQYTFAMSSGVAIGIAHRLTARAKQESRQRAANVEQRLPEHALSSAN